VTRGSTDILAVEDRLVAKTMAFIQSAAICAATRKAQSQRAWRMIAEINLVMKEIATGFESVQHMTNLSGKAFGRTPAKYRKATIQ
jgi:transcriptional regulator GlxA family with amidase domain